MPHFLVFCHSDAFLNRGDAFLTRGEGGQEGSCKAWLQVRLWSCHEFLERGSWGLGGVSCNAWSGSRYACSHATLS